MSKLNLSEDTIETLGMLLCSIAAFAMVAGAVRIFMAL